jgi:hypothetical protein
MDRGVAWRFRLLAAMTGVSIALAGCGSQDPPGPTTVPASDITSAAPSLDASAPASSSAVPAPSVRASSAPATVSFRIARSAIRLPASRSRSVALALGSGILVCGGLTAAGTTGSILWINPGTGQVSPAGALPSPVHDAGGSVLNGSGFIFGGGRLGPGSTVQGVKPAGQGVALGRLPAIRADLVAVTVAGQLIVVGGGTTTFYDRRVLATTDGVHFKVIASLITGVRYPAVAAIGGLVYVIGGSTAAGDTTAIQMVDPRTGAVRIVGHLSHGLAHASAFVVGGALLIAGGITGGRAQDGLWRLDPTSGVVRQVGRLPYAVSDMAVVVAGTSGYLIGGETPGLVASIITVSVR